MRRLRVARRPGRDDVRRFVGQIRGPAPASALRAVLDGVVVARTLRRRGARSLLVDRGARPAADDADRSIEVAAAVDAGLGLIPMAPTCLRRSVTLARELRRRGLEATIHVGVRRGEHDIEAHAWVQTGTVVVNDDPAVPERYAEFALSELERLAPLLR